MKLPNNPSMQIYTDVDGYRVGLEVRWEDNRVDNYRGFDINSCKSAPSFGNAIDTIYSKVEKDIRDKTTFYDKLSRSFKELILYMAEENNGK